MTSLFISTRLRWACFILTSSKQTTKVWVESLLLKFFHEWSVVRSRFSFRFFFTLSLSKLDSIPPFFWPENSYVLLSSPFRSLRCFASVKYWWHCDKYLSPPPNSHSLGPLYFWVSFCFFLFWLSLLLSLLVLILISWPPFWYSLVKRDVVK